MSLFLQLTHLWGKIELEHFARDSVRILWEMVTISMRQVMKEI